MAARRGEALSWTALQNLVRFRKPDFVKGKTNSHTHLRSFGAPENKIRVTFYRDHHAWCPYCQKIWLWLEEKKIPYRIKKVNMFCYGKKEHWYTKICPSGMLPAVDIDGRFVTESDDILLALETTFGTLLQSMRDPEVRGLRKLERQLFSAWCGWLCCEHKSEASEEMAKRTFIEVAGAVEKALGNHRQQGLFFLGEFSVVDCIFTPYLERMSASLFYYKGFTLRHPAHFPRICEWFEAMEARDTYIGTQSDFHTHAHALPPQMGGCYQTGASQQVAARQTVDGGIINVAFETSQPEPRESRQYALMRVLKHKDTLLKVNAYVAAKKLPKEQVDLAMRAALTNMMAMQPATSTSLSPLQSLRTLSINHDSVSTTQSSSSSSSENHVERSVSRNSNSDTREQGGASRTYKGKMGDHYTGSGNSGYSGNSGNDSEEDGAASLSHDSYVVPPPHCDAALRYLRDRICCPRDMPVWSARRLRQALELTAGLRGSARGPRIRSHHRFDQDTAPFTAKWQSDAKKK